MSKGSAVGPQSCPDRALLGKCMPHCPLSNKKKRWSFGQAVLEQFNTQLTALYIETVGQYNLISVVFNLRNWNLDVSCDVYFSFAYDDVYLRIKFLRKTVQYYMHYIIEL